MVKYSSVFFIIASLFFVSISLISLITIRHHIRHSSEQAFFFLFMSSVTTA